MTFALKDLENLSLRCSIVYEPQFNYATSKFDHLARHPTSKDVLRFRVGSHSLNEPSEDSHVPGAKVRLWLAAYVVPLSGHVIDRFGTAIGFEGTFRAHGRTGGERLLDRV